MKSPDKKCVPLDSHARIKICVDNILQVHEARAGETRGEREREYAVEMVFKIAIELEVQNRNPLFPELETKAESWVLIRAQLKGFFF